MSLDHRAPSPPSTGAVEPGVVELNGLLDDPRYAHLDLEEEFDHQAVLDDLKEQERRLGEAQRKLEASVFRMQSNDGLLEVTISGGASISAIDVHPDALREYRADELGPRLVNLLGEAMAHGAGIFRDTFSEVFTRPEDFDQVFDHWPAGPAGAVDEPRD